MNTLVFRRWRVAASLVAFAVMTAGPVQAAESGGLLLASNRVAALPVVIADNASKEIKTVAEELALFLERITGAPFEIQTGDGSKGVVLGSMAEFPEAGLAEALEIRDGFDGREAFVIRTEPERLLLLGGTDLGASHAAYRFLELIGCRWFFPAPEWEVIPFVPVLEVDFNETDRPALLSRRIWYGWGHFPDPALGSRAYRDYLAWARRNRMSASLVIRAHHVWEEIIGRNREAFETNPEWLALVGDERKGPQLCVSHLEVRRLCIEYARDYFKRRPDEDMVSMEPSDGGGQCECEGCAALGSVPDRVFGLANTVARAVAREFPGKMVGLLAYHLHSEPPAFELEPNVHVQLTAGFTTGRHTFEELLDLWPKRCRNLGFYDYFSVWAWDQDRLPGGRAGNLAYIRRQIPRYVGQNAVSMDAESGNNWGPHGRGYYIANKLMWNPDAGVDALLDDFYEKAFGPAAEPMRRYYERLDAGNQPLVSRHLLALAFRDLEEAARRAAGHEAVLARLDQIKGSLRYEHLRWQLDQPGLSAGERKSLTLATLTHVYRTRYSYMNHWQAMRQVWTVQAANEFNEPSWNEMQNELTPPWRGSGVYTREEVAGFFKEGLGYFQPQPVIEAEFSNELVPVRFENAKPAPTGHGFQGSARYAVYGDGNPIRIEVVTGTIGWARNRAEARYSLLTSEGEIVSEGRLPLDGETHRLELPAPRPGLFFFEFDDSMAGWRIAAPPGLPISLCLRREEGFRHAGHMQRMFFYVPKGTRQIEYFWKGGPHSVHGPDQAAVRDVETTGEFVFIPVPEGADGKAWSFTRFAPGHLWFFNVPNVLAGSPDSLLLPRELVRRDGLESRQKPGGASVRGPK
jgi:hypothetical protein